MHLGYTTESILMEIIIVNIIRYLVVRNELMTEVLRLITAYDHLTITVLILAEIFHHP